MCWYWVNFFLGSSLIVIHKRTFSRLLGCKHRKLYWLVEFSRTKAAATGFPNLPAVAAACNAEEWCSAVDIGGKKDFLKISSRSGVPVSRRDADTFMWIAATQPNATVTRHKESLAPGKPDFGLMGGAWRKEKSHCTGVKKLQFFCACIFFVIL